MLATKINSWGRRHAKLIKPKVSNTGFRDEAFKNEMAIKCIITTQLC